MGSQAESGAPPQVIQVRSSPGRRRRAQHSGVNIMVVCHWAMSSRARRTHSLRLNSSPVRDTLNRRGGGRRGDAPRLWGVGRGERGKEPNPGERAGRDPSAEPKRDSAAGCGRLGPFGSGRARPEHPRKPCTSFLCENAAGTFVSSILEISCIHGWCSLHCPLKKKQLYFLSVRSTY